MAKYGIPYQGSKGDLVHKIIACIPESENFYDLFGGGFSVSHFMIAHRKCRVHYNEIEPSTVSLIRDAIAGKYNYDVFKPKWISREMFEANRHDAYTRIIWSFGNNQKSYLFGKELENDKRSLHQAVVFDEWDDNAVKILGVNSLPNHLSIRGRRLACRTLVRTRGDRLDLEQLEQLERLEQLQQLERLEQLEMTSLSYDEVPILPNSIIYCDPPYKGTAGYTRSFDHETFWQWVRECPHPVYISEYTAPKDMKVKAAFRHKKTNSQTTTDSVEKLFWNGK
jgi:site-specific DNA-adenine methylase